MSKFTLPDLVRLELHAERLSLGRRGTEELYNIIQELIADCTTYRSALSGIADLKRMSTESDGSGYLAGVSEAARMARKALAKDGT